MTDTTGHHHGQVSGGHHHGDGHRHDRPGGLRGVLRGIFSPHGHDAADSVDDALESSAIGIR
ncbi:MAG: hypothetical protein ICV72_03145, partial [Aldersonia sp.]|nr:hypothetical protein [Aldersonia sp.]